MHYVILRHGLAHNAAWD